MRFRFFFISLFLYSFDAAIQCAFPQTDMQGVANRRGGRFANYDAVSIAHNCIAPLENFQRRHCVKRGGRDSQLFPGQLKPGSNSSVTRFG
jgi:hypothetical protein